MTIQFPESTSAPNLSGLTTATMDLAGLGAEVFDGDSPWGEDFPVEQCNFARLASLTAAALEDGISTVLLGPSFNLRSDTHLREARLDSLHGAIKLSERLRKPITAAVPGDPYLLRRAIEAVGSAQVTLEIHPVDTELETLVPLLEAAADKGVAITFALTGVAAEAADNSILAAYGSAVRLRTTDVERAVALRNALHRVNADIPVVADVYVIISACAMDAEERATLISMIGVDRYAIGAPRVLGTVHDVADHMEAWAQAGAADEFCLLPGSLPTDLASVVRGVLPLIAARREVDRLDERLTA